MAPTAIYEGGFQIIVHLNDHEPPHVHVRRDGADLRVYLNDLTFEPAHGRMNAFDERRAVRLVAKYNSTLLNIWRRHHP